MMPTHTYPPFQPGSGQYPSVNIRICNLPLFLLPGKCADLAVPALQPQVRDSFAGLGLHFQLPVTFGFCLKLLLLLTAHALVSSLEFVKPFTWRELSTGDSLLLPLSL